MEKTISAPPHNSVTAFANNGKSYGDRQDAIFSLLQRNSPLTDREIRLHLGFADMNAVRPRINELLTDGVLLNVGTVFDFVTNRPVRRVAIKKFMTQLV